MPRITFRVRVLKIFMFLSYEISNDRNASNTHFTGISENEEETFGLRAQGPYTPIKLINNVLTIRWIGFIFLCGLSSKEIKSASHA